MPEPFLATPSNSCQTLHKYETHQLVSRSTLVAMSDLWAISALTLETSVSELKVSKKINIMNSLMDLRPG